MPGTTALATFAMTAHQKESPAEEEMSRAMTAFWFCACLMVESKWRRKIMFTHRACYFKATSTACSFFFPTGNTAPALKLSRHATFLKVCSVHRVRYIYSAALDLCTRPAAKYVCSIGKHPFPMRLGMVFIVDLGWTCNADN